MRYIDGIAILDDELRFPPAETRHPDGLVAIGADLSPERMLLGYRSGIFPWSVNPVTWWSPDPRAIFDLEQGMYVSRRLARTIRGEKFRVTFDRAFSDVVIGCAGPRPDGQGTWISSEFFWAYQSLFLDGYAHSVETWLDGKLVGGVFGVAVEGFFAGESMFHRAPDASKVALFHLIERLREGGFGLFDIQLTTNHTASLGAIEIPRPAYLARLREALTLRPSWKP